MKKLCLLIVVELHVIQVMSVYQRNPRGGNESKSKTSKFSESPNKKDHHSQRYEVQNLEYTNDDMKKSTHGASRNTYSFIERAFHKLSDEGVSFLVWKRKGRVKFADMTGSGSNNGIYMTDGLGAIDAGGRKLYFASDGSVWRSYESGVEIVNGKSRIIPDKRTSFRFMGYATDYPSVKAFITGISLPAVKSDSRNRLPTVKGVVFEDISHKRARIRSSKNFGYVTHYSPDGRKWRAKNEIFRLRVINGDMDDLIYDGGYTEYTSDEGHFHWSLVNNPENLKKGFFDPTQEVNNVKKSEYHSRTSGRSNISLKTVYLTWEREGPLGGVDATGSYSSWGIYDTDGIGTIDDFGHKVYFATDYTVWRSERKSITFNENGEVEICSDKYDTFEFVGYAWDYPKSKLWKSSHKVETTSDEVRVGLPSVEGVIFENISNERALVRSSKNFGYLVHYAPGGSKWRTKDEIFIRRLMNHQFDHLIYDGGYTEYTSADGKIHWDEVGDPETIMVKSDKTSTKEDSGADNGKSFGKSLKKKNSIKD